MEINRLIKSSLYELFNRTTPLRLSAPQQLSACQPSSRTNTGASVPQRSQPTTEDQTLNKSGGAEACFFCLYNTCSGVNKEAGVRK